MTVSTYHISLALLICMFLVLTTWDWITYQGLIPGEDGFSQQSLIAYSS